MGEMEAVKFSRSERNEFHPKRSLSRRKFIGLAIGAATAMGAYVLVDSGTLWRLEYYYGVDTFILIWLASAWISLALIAGALILVSYWRGRRRTT